MSENWEECRGLYDTPLRVALEIIDDAMCNGFEFKIEGTKLYTREIVNNTENS